MAQMTALRRRMIEDMTVRNLSPATQQSYIYAVAKFSLWIGMEKGPRFRGDRRPNGTPLKVGFTMAPEMIGGQVWDVDRGDDREDPPGIFCSGKGDQGDLPRPASVAEGRAEGAAVGGAQVSLRAREAAFAATGSVEG